MFSAKSSFFFSFLIFIIHIARKIKLSLFKNWPSLTLEGLLFLEEVQDPMLNLRHLRIWARGAVTCRAGLS